MTIPSSGEHRFLKVFCKIKISVSQIQILVYLVKKEKDFHFSNYRFAIPFFFSSRKLQLGLPVCFLQWQIAQALNPKAIIDNLLHLQGSKLRPIQSHLRQNFYPLRLKYLEKSQICALFSPLIFRNKRVTSCQFAATLTK